MDYICPKEIDDLFDDEETVAVGRKRAADWAGSLELKEGDRVLLPGMGWMVYRPETRKH